MTSVVEVDGEPVRSPSTSTTTPAAPADRPSHRIGWVLAGLAVLSAAVCARAATRGAFYYDDYWNLHVVRSLPQGWSLLGRPVFGHVTPGANAWMRLVAGPGSGEYGWAVLQLAVFAALLPLGAYVAARSLGARRAPALAAAVVVVAGAGWAAASMWWSAGLNLYPSALSGMGIVASTRAMARGHRWGPFAAAGALAFGMCFTEGAIVFVVFALVVAAGDGSGPVRDRVVRLWSERRSWAIVGSPVLGLAVMRASAPAPLEPGPHPPLLDVALFPFALLFKGFVPLVFGLFPERFDLGGSAAVSVVAAFVLVGATLVVSDLVGSPRFRWAALALAAAVLTRGAMVAWSRLEVLGWGAAVELRYVADLAWLVPVVVAAHLPPRAAGSARARTVLVVAGGLALIGSVVGHARLVATAPAIEARAYRDQLGASAAQLPADTAVLDVAVPASVLGPQFGGYTFLSRTVVPTGLDLPMAPSRHLVAPDDQGRLHSVDLRPVSRLLPDEAFTATGAPGVDHRDGCWVAGARGALVWTPLSEPWDPLESTCRHASLSIL